jgi:ribonuclease D
MHVDYIDNKEALEVACSCFSHSEFIALDTEFIRERTYHPILALLQICDGHNLCIIDPRSIDDLSTLMNLLYDENIVKVMHSAHQDMEIFYYMNGEPFKPVFDSQVASALMGYGEQIGYAPLVKLLLNVELDKSQTRTDWLKRPLTKKQISYAADDVLYLAQIYPLQKSSLQQQGRLDWLKNDFQLLSDTKSYAPDMDNMWRKVKGFNKLKRKHLPILKTLAAWREAQAIEQDRPKRRIISDDTLLELCFNPPLKLADFNHNNYRNEHVIKKYAQQLLALVQSGLEMPEKDWPSLPEKYKLSRQQEALTDCLMAIINLSAAKNNISPSFLCSRKVLEQLTHGKRDLPILRGWRLELMGNELLDFLQGKSRLECHTGQLQHVLLNSPKKRHNCTTDILK